MWPGVVEMDMGGLSTTTPAAHKNEKWETRRCGELGVEVGRRIMRGCVHLWAIVRRVYWGRL